MADLRVPVGDGGSERVIRLDWWKWKLWALRKRLCLFCYFLNKLNGIANCEFESGRLGFD